QMVPKVEFPYLQTMYGLYGKKDEVENVHLASEGHDYGPNKRKAVYAFFQKRFALAAAPSESDLTLLPADSLRVFPPDHPRPAYALKTKQEIMDALFSKGTAVRPVARPGAHAPLF